MKILLCADVRLGAGCAEKLDEERAHRWQAARTEKLGWLLDEAAQNNASYVALYGRLFGRERVAESVIDSLFAAVKREARIQVLAFLRAEEYNRISYRSDIPENLHLISAQTDDSYLDESLALRMEGKDTEWQLGDHDSIWVRTDGTGVFVLAACGEHWRLPSFEPLGFEDARENSFGYGVFEWSQEELGPYRESANAQYTFRELELKLLAGDDEKEILHKVNGVVQGLDGRTFLRVALAGCLAFGLTLNGDALKAQLEKKVFFAEIYDNTIMEIDEDAFAHDISLRSEFVRLALQDDSLSESERSRLISCGWRALNGEEAAGE